MKINAAEMNIQQKREMLSQLLRNKQMSNLALSQERIWVMQMANQSEANNISMQYDLKVALNYEVFADSVKKTILDYNILCSCFMEFNNQPYSIVQNDIKPQMKYEDISMLDDKEKKIKIKEQADLVANTPISLNEAPLIRIVLLKKDVNEYHLIITMHQIIADVSSVSLFVNELFEEYDLRVRGVDEEYFKKQKYDFKDYVLQESLSMRKELPNSIEDANYKMDYIEDLQLYMDYPENRSLTEFYLSESQFYLSSEQILKIHEFANSNNISLQCILLTAYNILLMRYANQEEYSIGFVNRAEQYEQMIGPLVNVSICRIQHLANANSMKILEEVKQISQYAMAQNVSFEKIVEKMRTANNGVDGKLIQSLFSLHPISTKGQYETVTFMVEDVSVVGTRLDLSLFFTPLEEGMIGKFQYNQKLWDTQTMERFSRHFVQILTEMISMPYVPVQQLPLLSEQETMQITKDWNNTELPLPKSITLHEMFEQQAERTPDAVAVIYNNVELSYNELNRRANQVANYLLEKGVKPDSPIGVYFDRSEKMIIGLLAVLKAGGAYVPLDPEHPIERLNILVDDSNLKIILSEQKLSQKLSALASTVVYIDGEHNPVTQYGDKNVGKTSTEENLAYMIYTSGSTGKPKAVMIEHGNIVNNLTWRQHAMPLNSNDRVLQTYSYCFDPSVWSIFWPITSGAATCIIETGKHYDSSALIEIMIKNKITVYGAAPALHSALIEHPNMKDCTDLRYIFSGGDNLSRQLIESLHKTVDADIFNVYGPTESTIDATVWKCSRSDSLHHTPIGKPIGNTRIYIVDEQMQPIPIGVTGEILIGGASVARGYYGRPEMTRERFIKSPFGNEYIYRTGDMGRFKNDGSIEFLGRLDDQVKVRGYRIELGEISALLTKHTAVKEAIVLANQNNMSDKHLAAFIVLQQNSCVGNMKEVLTAYMLENLPEYMVPRTCCFIDEIPVNANGKIDRKYLLSLVTEESLSITSDYEAPKTLLEKEIAELIANVLSLKKVGRQDNLFELGANSLMITRITMRLSSMYGINIPVYQLFEEATTSKIAKLVEAYQQKNLSDLLEKSPVNEESEDIELDPSISPEGLPEANYLNPEHVFITGTTGYLGAFILKAVLQKTNAKVFCLIRAKNQEHGLVRIRENLEIYDIWDDTYTERIIAVPGDLGQPLLGLSESVFSKLADTVDTIYHNGALVNFSYPYSALKAPNVLGTQEVLKMACTTTLKAVHFVSTIDVFLAAHVTRPYHEVDIEEIQVKEHLNGYPLSKWVSEKLVSTARKRGVPVCIFRPGLMMSHTETGASHITDYLIISLKGFLELGLLPRYDHLLNAVPVDYAADTLVHISLKAESISKNFHIWNKQDVHYMEIYEWLKSYGYDFEVVPNSIAQQAAAKVDADHPLYPLVSIYFRNEWADDGSLEDYVKNNDFTQELTNTFLGISDSPLECRLFDKDLMWKCMSYLIKHKFMPTPEEQATKIRNSIEYSKQSKESC